MKTETRKSIERKYAWRGKLIHVVGLGLTLPFLALSAKSFYDYLRARNNPYVDNAIVQRYIDLSHMCSELNTTEEGFEYPLRLLKGDIGLDGRSKYVDIENRSEERRNAISTLENMQKDVEGLELEARQKIEDLEEQGVVQDYLGIRDRGVDGFAKGAFSTIAFLFFLGTYATFSHYNKPLMWDELIKKKLISQEEYLEAHGSGFKRVL